MARRELYQAVCAYETGIKRCSRLVGLAEAEQIMQRWGQEEPAAKMIYVRPAPLRVLEVLDGFTVAREVSPEREAS